MSIPARTNPVILNTFLDLLIPLFLTAAGGDTDTARAVALEMLADFNPQSPRELGLATEAIGNSLKSLAMLGKSTESGLAPAGVNDTLKWATSLARSGHQAQRRLDDLQRARRTAARRRQMEEDAQADPPPPTVTAITTAAAAAAAAAAPGPATGQAAPPPSVPTGTTADAPDTAPEPAVSQDPAANVATAEKALAKAEKLLALMQDHVKGGVPPHSQAGQQLRDQHRAVEAARMALAQARRAAVAATQSSAGLAAA